MKKMGYEHLEKENIILKDALFRIEKSISMERKEFCAKYDVKNEDYYVAVCGVIKGITMYTFNEIREIDEF